MEWEGFEDEEEEDEDDDDDAVIAVRTSSEQVLNTFANMLQGFARFLGAL